MSSDSIALARTSCYHFLLGLTWQPSRTRRTVGPAADERHPPQVGAPWLTLCLFTFLSPPPCFADGSTIWTSADCRREDATRRRGCATETTTEPAARPWKAARRAEEGAATRPFDNSGWPEGAKAIRGGQESHSYSSDPPVVAAGSRHIRVAVGLTPAGLQWNPVHGSWSSSSVNVSIGQQDMRRRSHLSFWPFQPVGSRDAIVGAANEQQQRHPQKPTDTQTTNFEAANEQKPETHQHRAYVWRENVLIISADQRRALRATRIPSLLPSSYAPVEPITYLARRSDSTSDWRLKQKPVDNSDNPATMQRPMHRLSGHQGDIFELDRSRFKRATFKTVSHTGSIVLLISYIIIRTSCEVLVVLLISFIFLFLLGPLFDVLRPPFNCFISVAITWSSIAFFLLVFVVVSNDLCDCYEETSMCTSKRHPFLAFSVGRWHFPDDKCQWGTEKSHRKSSKCPVWGEPQMAKILLVLFDPAAPLPLILAEILPVISLLLQQNVSIVTTLTPPPNGWCLAAVYETVTMPCVTFLYHYSVCVWVYNLRVSSILILIIVTIIVNESAFNVFRLFDVETNVCHKRRATQVKSLYE